MGKSFDWIIGDKIVFYLNSWNLISWENEGKKEITGLRISQAIFCLSLSGGPVGAGVSAELIIHFTRLHLLCSLTERAQLLKNVFKKNHVNLYRSESLQQNLLRKYLSSNFFLKNSAVTS